MFQLSETVKAALISHHAPLCCLWTHSVCIVKYVQCSSVVRRRQSLLDLIVSGADDVFKDRDLNRSFPSQTVTRRKKQNKNIHILYRETWHFYQIRQSTYFSSLQTFLYSLLNKKGILDQNRMCSEPDQQKRCDNVWREFHHDIQPLVSFYFVFFGSSFVSAAVSFWTWRR